jgi:hypothetical protein
MGFKTAVTAVAFETQVTQIVAYAPLRLNGRLNMCAHARALEPEIPQVTMILNTNLG